MWRDDQGTTAVRVIIESGRWGDQILPYIDITWLVSSRSEPLKKKSTLGVRYCYRCPLVLSFPEMLEECFDSDSHSARVLEFEAIRKTSQIKKFIWSFSDGGPWSPGRLRSGSELWDERQPSEPYQS
jgi:hypothetical protein